MKRIDYKELTKQINEVKRKLQNKPISFKHLKQIFKENNLPTYDMFLREFVRRCMKKNGQLWEFKNNNPIYYKIIEGIYQDNNQYQIKYKKVSKAIKVENIQVIDKEQDSINYLKSLGYKVFKVTQMLEKI